MFQKVKTPQMLIVVLALALGFASIAAVAKSDNAKGSDKAAKSEQAQGKKKTVELKNFQRADEAKGQTNAQLHKEKTGKAVQKLKDAADMEEVSGDAEVSDQLEQVADDQEQNQEETADAIEEAESRGKVKTFLLGTDYKNLGQLRSSLAHNANDVRKLTKALAGAETPEGKALIEAELETLMQERERVRGIIYDKQDDFSLFGWVSRIMTGYVPVPATDPAEDQLTTEVETAIATVTSPVVQ